MKKILLLLGLSIGMCLQLEAQSIKMSQIERCYKNGVAQDSCIWMTDETGRLAECIKISDLLGAYVDPDICDKVDSCLSAGNGELLCEVLGLLPVGDAYGTDYVIARTADGLCKRMLVDSILSQTQLCASLSFPIVSYSGSDYFLIKTAGGACKRVLASDVKGNMWTCDSTMACLDGENFCTLLNGLVNQNVQSTGKIVWITNSGLCRKGDISSIPGIGAIDCDSVTMCLKDGALCEALRSFSSGTPVGTDSIWYVSGGTCKKGRISTLPYLNGSVNCDSVLACVGDSKLDSLTVDDSDCIDLTFTPGDNVLSAVPIISPNSGNGLQCLANGLFVDTTGMGAGGNCDSVYLENCDMKFKCGSTGVIQTVRPRLDLDGNDLLLTLDDLSGPCEASRITLPPGVTGVSMVGTDCNPTLRITSNGVNYDVNLPVYTITRTGDNIFLRSNGTQCGLGVCATCIALTAPELKTDNGPKYKVNFDSEKSTSPNIKDIQNWDKIPRFKTHAQAHKKLKSGDLYFVGKYYSLQVRP